MKKLTIKKLSNYLGKIVEHNIQSSLMIWGAPGIGKSSVISSPESRLDSHDIVLRYRD
jgi:replication-associated recombination protein RarA